DASGNGRAEVMGGRPLQVAAVTSALLAAPRWHPLVDAGRIGVAGFSAGGYTSLLLVGAKPRFELFIGYCERHAGDAEICGLVQELGDGAQAALASLQAQVDRMGDTRD